MIVLETRADTEAFGVRLAALLQAGDLVILSGPLGAGKTALTAGIGKGLGVRGAITSPTFVIARVHRSLTSGPNLVHVDAYRLTNLDDLETLDLDASLDDSVTVVEWGEGKVETLSESHLNITMNRDITDTIPTTDPAGGPRTLTLNPTGPTWQTRLPELSSLTA